MTNPAKSYYGCPVGGLVVGGKTSTPATTLTVTDTVHPRLYQRVGTAKTLMIGGSYTGPATRIQARACPAGTGLTALESAYPFSTVVTNPTGGTFSASLSVPQGDGWVVQVRDAIDHAVGSTGTHSFGVGSFIALIGQSNMENLFTVYAWAYCGAKGAYTHHGVFARLGNINDNFPPNSFYDMYNGRGGDYAASGWTNDAGYYIGTYLTLLANTLVLDLGCPVVILPYAASGTTISVWQPGQTYLNNLLNDVDTIGGDFEAAIWLQGENDASTGTSGATYQSKLQTLFDTCKAHTGRSSSNFHFGVVVVGPITNAYPGMVDEATAPIRKAQLDFVAANTSNGAFLAGTDIDGNLAGGSVHIDMPSQLSQATRYAAAIKRRLSGASYGIEGPVITSASRAGTVVTVAVTQQGGSALLDGLGGSGGSLQGFRVFDSGTPMTISSTSISGNTIVLTLSATPSGTVTMDYAMANAPFGATTSPAAVCYDNQTIPGSALGLPLQPKPLFTVS